MKTNRRPKKTPLSAPYSQPEESGQWLDTLGRIIARVHLARLQKSADYEAGNEIEKRKGK